MLVIIAIAFIVLVYKQDRQDKLRRQKEAQEEAQKTAARLELEQNLKRKSEQWKNTHFFKELAKYLTTNINEYVNRASTVKISRSDNDSFTIRCLENCIDIRSSTNTNIGILSPFGYDHEVSYNKLGFDAISDDDSHITIASLNFALLQYLKNEYQSIPQISFSSKIKSLSDCICTRGDKSLAWYCSDFSIICGMTKVHPLLEEISLP